MVVFSTTAALQLQKWLLAPPGDLAATDLQKWYIFKRYSASPSPLHKSSLYQSLGISTSWVSFPFYILLPELQKKIQITYTKHSRPFHFSRTHNHYKHLPPVILYLKSTEKVSCFSFQRPKVPVPEKRTQTELVKYPGDDTGKGRNLASSYSRVVCHWS